MLAQRLLERLRQHRHPIFGTLSIADHDLTALEVHVLDAQAQTLHQAQARSIQQRGDQPFVAFQLCKYGLHLATRQHHRQPLGSPGAHQIAEIIDCPPEHVAVQEQ